MKLFGKKKESKESVKVKKVMQNDIENNAKSHTVSAAPAAIKVLGSGCAKCNELEKNTKEALQELGMKDAIEHVTDFEAIAAMGVMSTPALVVDDKVVSMGKVLSKVEAIKLLEKVRS